MSVLRQIVAAEDATIAGRAAGALCTAAVRHPGAVETWALSPHGVTLLAKLMRSHSAWEVRRCAATMLAAVARRLRRLVRDFKKKGLLEEQSQYSISHTVALTTDDVLATLGL